MEPENTEEHINIMLRLSTWEFYYSGGPDSFFFFLQLCDGAETIAAHLSVKYSTGSL